MVLYMNNRTSTLQARAGIAASKPALEEQILLTSADSGCNSLASSSREQCRHHISVTRHFTAFPTLLVLSLFECARKIFFHFWSAPSCSFLCCSFLCLSAPSRYFAFLECAANFMLLFKSGQFVFRFLVRRHFFPFFGAVINFFFSTDFLPCRHSRKNIHIYCAEHKGNPSGAWRLRG